MDRRKTSRVQHIEIKKNFITTVINLSTLRLNASRHPELERDFKYESVPNLQEDAKLKHHKTHILSLKGKIIQRAA